MWFFRAARKRTGGVFELVRIHLSSMLAGRPPLSIPACCLPASDPGRDITIYNSATGALRNAGGPDLVGLRDVSRLGIFCLPVSYVSRQGAAAGGPRILTQGTAAGPRRPESMNCTRQATTPTARIPTRNGCDTGHSIRCSGRPTAVGPSFRSIVALGMSP